MMISLIEMALIVASPVHLTISSATQSLICIYDKQPKMPTTPFELDTNLVFIFVI